MQIDVARSISAIVRGVEVREVDGKEARAVIASRRYETSISDLWDALTNGERLPRWFLPVSGDLRLGGNFKIEGNASGTIIGCEPPRLLAVTWSMGEAVSWVTVRLAQDGDATQLELEHVAHVDPIFWGQFGPGAVGVGWDLALMGLGLHIAAGAANDPAEAQKWVLQDEGRRFVAMSSDDWARAAIASGDDEVDAKARAVRTTGFYTGQPVAD